MSRTLITETTEETLLETISVCHKVNLPLRCLYLAFSRIENKPADWRDRTLAAIADAVEDVEAIFYVCEDTDLFILSRVTTIKSLLRVLGSLPKDLVPAPDEGLAHLFEVNIEWQPLTKMVQEKIAKRQQRLEDAARQEQADREGQRARQIRNVEMDMMVNAQMIASIPSRRQQRKTPGILVVEDDVFSQRLVANALRAQHDVFVAADGRQALAAYIREAPDMVFLDINLPDMTGIDILREIFSIDAQAHVVMLSGNGSRENVMAAMQGGAKGFVGKPFTVEKLQQSIDKCPAIQGKRTRREMANA